MYYHFQDISLVDKIRLPSVIFCTNFVKIDNNDKDHKKKDNTDNNNYGVKENKGKFTKTTITQ